MTVAAMTIALSAGAVLSAVPASASVGDPIQTGCASDAYTVSTQPIKNSGGGTVGQVQLRYSPRCGTNWAKTVSNIGTAYVQAIVASPSDSASYSATSTSVYTDMVYAPTAPTPCCSHGLCDRALHTLAAILNASRMESTVVGPALRLVGTFREAAVIALATVIDGRAPDPRELARGTVSKVTEKFDTG
ncbi:YjfA family protein [Amycolatopsis sp. NBC_00355]|uniref:DUF2690 domain-containing protein n=1 Tax=Amycolatopsis sp. NBC_00355 TaxID=2975957 RepID=UPI002E257009